MLLKRSANHHENGQEDIHLLSYGIRGRLHVNKTDEAKKMPFQTFEVASIFVGIYLISSIHFVYYWWFNPLRGNHFNGKRWQKKNHVNRINNNRILFWLGLAWHGFGEQSP